jgi:NadR type nicotinamide-nucleotide adenylyltransferase
MGSEKLRKIVVIGPESTGKSTLCEQLAQHFRTRWCPEYAREYLLRYGKGYGYEDLLKIAKGQIALEEEMAAVVNDQWEKGKQNLPIDSLITGSKVPILFIDTDLYVMKVWCEFVFGKCHPWILQQIAQRKYDLYLLCNNDLPWVKDELREYPDLATREKLFRIYKDCMIQQSTPWGLIEGDSGQRLEIAIRAVNKYLGDH